MSTITAPFVWLWDWLGSGPVPSAAQVVWAMLGVSYISYVLVYSSIGKPLRDLWVNLGAAKAGTPLGRFCAKIGEGIHCPFCGGFWVTILFQLVFRFDILHADAWGIPKQLSVLFSMAVIGGVQALIAFGMGMTHHGPCETCTLVTSPQSGRGAGCT